MDVSGGISDPSGDPPPVVCVTTTLNVHVAVRAWASRAVHVSAVVPMANVDPDAGRQLAVTGAVPPPVFGAGKSTITGPGADTAWLLGQVMVGGGDAATVVKDQIGPGVVPLGSMDRHCQKCFVEAGNGFGGV
jgi:hypothetical protein